MDRVFIKPQSAYFLCGSVLSLVIFKLKSRRFRKVCLRIALILSLFPTALFAMGAARPVVNEARLNVVSSINFGAAAYGGSQYSTLIVYNSGNRQVPAIEFTQPSTAAFKIQRNECLGLASNLPPTDVCFQPYVSPTIPIPRNGCLTAPKPLAAGAQCKVYLEFTVQGTQQTTFKDEIKINYQASSERNVSQSVALTGSVAPTTLVIEKLGIGWYYDGLVNQMQFGNYFGVYQTLGYGFEGPVRLFNPGNQPIKLKNISVQLSSTIEGDKRGVNLRLNSPLAYDYATSKNYRDQNLSCLNKSELSPGTRCEFDVVLDVLKAFVGRFYVRIDYDNGSAKTASILGGIAAEGPLFRVVDAQNGASEKPGALFDFGQVSIGSAKQVTLNLRNDGSEAAYFNPYAVSTEGINQSLRIVNSSCIAKTRIYPKETCDFTFEYFPRSAQEQMPLGKVFYRWDSVPSSYNKKQDGYLELQFRGTTE